MLFSTHKKNFEKFFHYNIPGWFSQKSDKITREKKLLLIMRISKSTYYSE